MVVVETDPKPILAPCRPGEGSVNTVGESKLAQCVCPLTMCWVDNKNFVIQDRFKLLSEH